MPLLDISYQHWKGVHLGAWSRRWAIARNGLTACLRNKWMRRTVLLCWLAALGLTGFLFFVGQLLVSDSVVVQWVGNFNPQLQSFARMLTTWLEQHPEVSVRTTQDLVFFYSGTWLMRISIYAIGMAIPALITRDLASKAIIIYSSKAVSRGDYLLGKFATAFGLMTLTWLGPVCAAWFMGNLLAPDWRFFWHSRVALFHVLGYGIASLSVLSILALGVSAISPKDKSTVVLWYAWWIVGAFLAPIAMNTQPWLRHLSFSYNLDQIAYAVFQLGHDITLAQDNIPVLGQMLRDIRPETLSAINEPKLEGAVLSLLFMLGGAALIIRKRVKPE